MKRKIFSVIAVASFVIGLLILFYGTGILRNYVGDVIAVIFLYSLLSVVISWRPSTKVVVVGLIALAIECAQLFIAHPGNGLQQATIGAYFDLLDLVAYALGLAVGFGIDRALRSKN